MHLIVIIKEHLPHNYDGSNNEIDKLIQSLVLKKYNANLHDAWNCIRPRELRLVELTFPESEKDKVLMDIAIQCGGKLDKISKILNMPLIGKGIQKAIGIEYIDTEYYRDKAKELGLKPKSSGATMGIIGIISDDHDEKGKEMI